MPYILNNGDEQITPLPYYFANTTTKRNKLTFYLQAIGRFAFRYPHKKIVRRKERRIEGLKEIKKEIQYNDHKLYKERLNERILNPCVCWKRY